MVLQEIIERIEKRYPRTYACSWDNTGLQVGDRNQQVETVYVALDATEKTIGAAREAGAQLLLTHHPLLFESIRQVTTDTVSGRRVLAVLAAGMSCYSMHTNYDVLGLADLAAERLGLTETVVLEEVYGGEGIGRIGILPEVMTVENCAVLVRQRFDLPNVKVFGDPKAQVRRTALSPGAGKSMAGAAKACGAEVLITGDIDHHTGIDLWDAGIAVIDAGHYGIEHIYIEDLRKFLEKHCPELQVYTAPVEQPFMVL